MTVRVERELVHLEGACLVEDAEPLLLAFQEGATSVDFSGATRLHLSIVQILIAYRPKVFASPSEPFLLQHILPLLKVGAGAEILRQTQEPG